MKKLLFLSIILLMCASLVLGCNTPTTTPAKPTTPTPASKTPAATTQAPTPKYGGTFRYIDPRSPATSIGWVAESMPPAGMYACLMIEGLNYVDRQGLPKPRLATEWSVAPDLKSMTFTLRKSVKFHDGSDFNGAVAKWNIDQYIAAKVSGVKNFSSVDLIDDYTIRINLKQYSNTLFGNVASIGMVSKDAFDKVGKEGLRWNPVGTGPFKFVSYQRDVVLKCARFDNYWKGRPYLDAIEAQFIIDPLTASASFEAGEADAVGGDVVKVLYDLQQKKYEILKHYSGVITLIPDSKNSDSIFANPKVRQAIDYAIDRDAIVKARGFGLWTTTYQFCAPGASAYITDLPARTYNPEKAKQLLAEAGYPTGFKTKIIGDSSTTDKEATVAVQGFFSKVGIDAQLDWVDYASFLKYVMGGWQNAILACANGVGANQNQYIDTVWSQNAAFFPSVLKTGQMQALINESMGAKDYNPALVQKVLRYMHDEAMFIPLYCITRGHAVQPYVRDTGFYTLGSPANSWQPGETWLSK